jgi:hypothetical protein
MAHKIAETRSRGACAIIVKSSRDAPDSVGHPLGCRFGRDAHTLSFRQFA